jgi:hypothetical protein
MAPALNGYYELGVAASSSRSNVSTLTTCALTGVELREQSPNVRGRTSKYGAATLPDVGSVHLPSFQAAMKEVSDRLEDMVSAVEGRIWEKESEGEPPEDRFLRDDEGNIDYWPYFPPEG